MGGLIGKGGPLFNFYAVLKMGGEDSLRVVLGASIFIKD
jgi:hypothetical protein